MFNKHTNYHDFLLDCPNWLFFYTFVYPNIYQNLESKDVKCPWPWHLKTNKSVNNEYQIVQLLWKDKDKVFLNLWLLFGIHDFSWPLSFFLKSLIPRKASSMLETALLWIYRSFSALARLAEERQAQNDIGEELIWI